jgi:hypothetical protein
MRKKTEMHEHRATASAETFSRRKRVSVARVLQACRSQLPVRTVLRTSRRYVFGCLVLAALGCSRSTPPDSSGAEASATASASMLPAQLPTTMRAAEKMCDDGKPEACTFVGQGLMRSFVDAGIPNRLELGATFLKRGCDGKHAVGCSELGRAYMMGKGVAEDWDQARHYFQKACDLGDRNGCKQFELIKNTRGNAKRDGG